MNFVARIYKKQLLRGRFFVHEHPASATSWDERAMVQLAAHPDVVVVRADQCQYGLTTPTESGDMAPAMKPTRFMTNAAPMAKLLQRRCDGSHTHQP